MSLDNFLELQLELWWAFGWMARWWLILFTVSGFAMAVMIFFLNVISAWIESR